MMTGSEVKDKNLDNGKKGNETLRMASGIAVVHRRIMIDVEKVESRNLLEVSSTSIAHLTPSRNLHHSHENLFWATQ